MVSFLVVGRPVGLGRVAYVAPIYLTMPILHIEINTSTACVGICCIIHMSWVLWVLVWIIGFPFCGLNNDTT